MGRCVIRGCNKASTDDGSARVSMCIDHLAAWGVSGELRYASNTGFMYAVSDFVRRIEAEERNSNPVQETKEEAPKQKEPRSLSDVDLWGSVKE